MVEIRANPLKLTDLLPGVLSLSMRMPCIGWNMIRYRRFKGDMPLTIGSVLERNAQKYPDRTAILFDDISLSYKQFNRNINRHAHYFLSIGLKKGDVAAVLMENRPELLVVIAALAKIGAIAGLINTSLKKPGLLSCIELIHAKIFVIGMELLDTFEQIKSDLNVSASKLQLFVPGLIDRLPAEGTTNLIEQARDLSPENPPLDVRVTLQDPFAYVFTSGTTGFPKAVILTHRRWVGAMYWFGGAVLNLKPGDVHYCTLPFYHTNALVISWGACAGQGATLAIRHKFSATAFWEDCRKFGATSFIYIGEICRYLLNRPPGIDDQIHTVDKVVGNGLQPGIWQQFQTRFGISKIYEFYGAAEVPLVFTNIFNLNGTIGCCLTPYAIVRYDPTDDVLIRNESGRLQKVPPGESGLLLADISNEALFSGYTNVRETEKRIIRDVFSKGDIWFNTGDVVRNLGYRHAQFVDRIGETFRRKGENISTYEVEAVVNRCRDVRESAVFGVSIPGVEGKVGMAVIVPSSTAEPFDLKGLASLLLREMPNYAVPMFIRLATEIQTTSTYKIKKQTFKAEGYDPHQITDPLYILLPDRSTFIPLTESIYGQLMSGQVHV